MLDYLFYLYGKKGLNSSSANITNMSLFIFDAFWVTDYCQIHIFSCKTSAHIFIALSVSQWNHKANSHLSKFGVTFDDGLILEDFARICPWWFIMMREDINSKVYLALSFNVSRGLALYFYLAGFWLLIDQIWARVKSAFGFVSVDACVWQFHL